jgi:hypothetical protein
VELAYGKDLEELNEGFWGKLKNQNAERNADSKGQVCKALDKNRDSFGNWTRSHACYILAKNLSICCPSLKTSSETKFKSNQSAGGTFKAAQGLSCGVIIAGCFYPGL